MFVLLFVCISRTGVSQGLLSSDETYVEQPDSLIRRNSASILLERNLNTFDWTGRAVVDTAVAGTSIGLQQAYTSNTILLDGTPSRKLHSTKQNVALQLGVPLANDFRVRTHWSSLVYSDKKDVGLSKASSHAVLGGVEYDLLPSVSVMPMAGYRWENQALVDDRGPSYEISARSRTLSFDGYALDGSAQLHEDRLDPRKFERHHARVRMQKSFTSGTRDSMALSVSRNRRDFYALADNSIESRADNIITFHNILDYEVADRLVTTLAVNVTSRTLDKDLRSLGGPTDSLVRFNTVIDEFRLEAHVQAEYHSQDDRTLALARLQYIERDESHNAKPIANASPNIQALFAQRNREEQTKDNLSRRTTLSGMLRLPLSSSDNLMISAAGGILRYDTPSGLNVEDRDELLLAVSLGSSHQLNRFLHVSMSLEGNLSHLVYLFRERSANNNYNRILRLSPRVTYRPTGAAVTVNTFEVLANYTVYDFEEQLNLTRSFSYRQFGWTDSTSVDLTYRIGLDFFGYLKLYERGQLKWTEFTERTENSFVDQTYAFQVRFAPFRETFAAVGIRYFSQSRFAYGEQGKHREGFLRSIGPTCVILWNPGLHSQLSIRGWYENRTLTDGPARSFPNLAMNILINF